MVRTAHPTQLPSWKEKAIDSIIAIMDRIFLERISFLKVPSAGRFVFRKHKKQIKVDISIIMIFILLGYAPLTQPTALNRICATVPLLSEAVSDNVADVEFV